MTNPLAGLFPDRLDLRITNDAQVKMINEALKDVEDWHSDTRRGIHHGGYLWYYPEFDERIQAVDLSEEAVRAYLKEKNRVTINQLTGEAISEEVPLYKQVNACMEAITSLMIDPSQRTTRDDKALVEFLEIRNKVDSLREVGKREKGKFDV